MKKYLTTFCIAFLMTLFACFFNYFQILYVAVLGGVPLAVVAYWRMFVADKAGQSLVGHIVAYMLGWFLVFVCVMLPLLSSTFGSLMIYLSWGMAALLGCIVYRLRRSLMTSVAVSLVVWIAFVLTIVPAWANYIDTLPKTNAGWVLPWNK